MIRKGLALVLCCGTVAFTVVGCGGNPGGNVDLVQAGGTITLNGKALEGATVSFIPEKGPLASGVTNKDGKFTLATGTSPGAQLGPCQVTVTAVAPGSSQLPAGASPMNAATPPKNEEEVKQRLEAMNMMKKVQATPDGGASAAPKSIVNVKFGNPKTSGFTATIDKDPAKNQFTFDVTE